MLETFSQIIIMIIPLLFAVTIHEAAHGLAAFKMGDATAKMAGRVTLNPIKHLDPFGSFILPLLLKLTHSPILFGYAKPVPVNPYYFKDFRIGTIIVSSAGVVANLICAVISAMFFQMIYRSQHIWYGTFASPFIAVLFKMLGYSVIINVVLMVFNLIPVPPLDGSRILAMFLPDGLRESYEKIERYGMVILIVLIMTNILDKLIDFFVNPLIHLLIGI